MPLRLSALQLIGLTSPSEGDWASLRALQYRDLHRMWLIRLLSHTIAASVTIGLFAGKVWGNLLACWCIALAMSVYHVTRTDKALSDIDRRQMTRKEFGQQALAVAVLGTLWAVPLLAFVPQVGVAEHFALWTLVAMLVAGSATLMAQAPITTLIFATICGSAGVFSFALRGNASFAIVSATFCILVVLGALQNARTCLLYTSDAADE